MAGAKISTAKLSNSHGGGEERNRDKREETRKYRETWEEGKRGRRKDGKVERGDERRKQQIKLRRDTKGKEKQIRQMAMNENEKKREKR